VIGVIPKPEQSAVVEEFFELFKTPWEIYRPHHRYDVLIAAAGEAPRGAAVRLLIWTLTTWTAASITTVARCSWSWRWRF
jgi:hypothetical protein